MCFPIVFATYLVHLFVSGYDRFYFDADNYWDLGKQFRNHGHFSLVSYDGVFRGYSVPLLNHVLQALASGFGVGSVTIVKVFGALLAATLGVVVAPRLARALFSGAEIGPARVLALNGVLFLYWRDHFDFPLSDFPSLLVAALGVLALLRATPWGFLAAGVCLGVAVNARPAYLPALAVGILAAALQARRADWTRRGVAAGLVVAGALVASFPQMLINHHQRGTWSPQIPRQKEIARIQLSVGMRAQKYETYVGPRSGYPRPEVFYLDPSTQHVLKEDHVPPRFDPVLGQRVDITSYGQYVGIVVRHPFAMAAAYARHLFNGVDVQYPTPYVRDLGDRSTLLSLLQYTLLFAAVVRLLLPGARRSLGRIRWWGFGVLASACLTSIPGPVEPRFFLPLQLLVYFLVCFGPKTRAFLLGDTLDRRITLAASYGAFLLVCLIASSATRAQLEYRISSTSAGTPAAALGAPHLPPR